MGQWSWMFGFFLEWNLCWHFVLIQWQRWDIITQSLFSRIAVYLSSFSRWQYATFVNMLLLLFLEVAIVYLFYKQIFSQRIAPQILTL